jgi:hypothetical protein
MFLGRLEGVRDTKTNKLVVSTSLIASHKLHAISYTMYLLVCVLCQYFDTLQSHS